MTITSNDGYTLKIGDYPRGVYLIEVIFGGKKMISKFIAQ